MPQGWAWCKISDVFSVERGGSPRPIKDYLTDSADGINWIKIADASASGKYITTVREKIRPQGLKKTRRVFVGDLLLTNSMSFGHPYILQVDGCIHDGWLVLHAFDSQLDKEFFYHLLSSRFVYVSFSITASGGVVQNLNAAKVSDTSIPLPPLAEQKRIVAYIEKLFRVADSLGVAVDGLENAAKRLDKKILDLAIRGKLVPQDPSDEPASELVKRIAASHKSPCKNQGKPIDPPFDIPDSWEWVRLGEVSDIVRGTGIKRNETTSAGVQCVRYGEIYTHYGESFAQTFSFVPKAVADKCHDAKYGDVLCTLTGENEVEIAKATAYTGKERLVIGGDLARISNHPYDSMLLVYFMFSPFMISQKASVCTGGMIVHMGKSALSNLYIPLPPLAEQKRIVAKIEELRTVIKSLTT